MTAEQTEAKRNFEARLQAFTRAGSDLLVAWYDVEALGLEVTRYPAGVTNSFDELMAEFRELEVTA